VALLKQDFRYSNLIIYFLLVFRVKSYHSLIGLFDGHGPISLIDFKRHFWLTSLLEARAEMQKYFRCFLVEMKSLEFAFKIN